MCVRHARGLPALPGATGFHGVCLVLEGGRHLESGLLWAWAGECGGAEWAWAGHLGRFAEDQ